jgi:hypothetical protein
MSNHDDRLDRIIDLAMQKHRARGNASLTDEARVEIRNKWQNSSDYIDRKTSEGWGDDRFAEHSTLRSVRRYRRLADESRAIWRVGGGRESRLDWLVPAA